jgi:hypothetical protein
MLSSSSMTATQTQILPWCACTMVRETASPTHCGGLGRKERIEDLLHTFIRARVDDF